MNCKSHRLGTTAFCLIELAVTVAIVGILAALILPALGRSRRKASEARCASNLRQIHLGFILYPADNRDRCPARFVWSGKLWNASDFLGGKDGSDGNYPPARVRPLHPYLAAEEAFRCPADVGIVRTNQGGVLMQPSCFDVMGLSYVYHSGMLLKGEEQSTSGIGGNSMDWAPNPAGYVLLYEHPALGAGQKLAYWHRARKPGTGSSLQDGERGPRYSAFVFLDGHTEFIDRSGIYTDTLPGGDGP